MSFETQQHGRYTIKSGPLKGEWAANGFRGKVRVATAAGASREDAVSQLKIELDRLDAIALSERDEEGAPPARVYQDAFERTLPHLPHSYIAMLKAHISAPDYLISATRLAEAAGYSGYEGANLHYGKLGFRIAEEIGFEPSKRADGTPIWTCVLARDPSLDTEFPQTSFLEGLLRAVESGHFEWQMRSQVVQALKALGF